MTHVEWTIDVTMMEANKKKTEEKKRETIVLIFWAIIKNEWMNATENDGEATKQFRVHRWSIWMEPQIKSGVIYSLKLELDASVRKLWSYI